MNKVSRSLAVASLLVTGLLAAGVSLAAAQESIQAEARSIIAKLESPRGICAVLGEAGGELAFELARNSDLLVYVQLPDGQQVQSARRAAEAAGLLNRRVYIEQGADARLHLADNIADVIVVRPAAAGAVRERELLRALRPGGKALIGDKCIVKPPLAGVDDWTHPYHGPDNNPQSRDQRARAPYLTQFLAKPWYCPMPEVTVAAAGRVFKAFGNRAFKRPQWPVLSTLIAINGYNGTLLWKRPLDPDFMIHRNTMIATPDTLYLGDNDSCKLLDAATGELKGEITVPEGISDGPAWKWMALEDGTLYALVGEREPPGDKLKGTAFRGAGWPWWKIPNYPWGFGRTFLAIDPSSKQVLWHHREQERIDSRGTCMKGGRIYYYSHRKFIGCLDARTGKVVWKSDDPQVLAAIGEHRPAQRAVWGFASTVYVKCGGEALYFAGPQRTRLVAVSTRDGKLLWQYPKEGNFQLVVRSDGLYAMGSNHPSVKFALLTGRELLRLPHRVACTRATGSVDRVFVRGGGTRCWDVAAGRWLHISPMRPACHDGVVIAGGQLYWGPWMCGCNLSLLGIISLGPAGDFDYCMKATESERLERADNYRRVAPLAASADDWPAFRHDNARTTRSPCQVPTAVTTLWQFRPPHPGTPTAPTTAGDLAFISGSDGVVRAVGAADGKLRWTAYTGGFVRYPPAIADGRALVGSGDGWVYAFEARSGRRLWRFRAAPLQRKIPVYGTLSSTWPVGPGVLVGGGVAYAAAGIANYDGTHVYALDAATGSIRWQNNDSGGTESGQGSGACVQGDLLLHDGKLYMAGGNRIAVAAYDVADGKFSPAAPSRGRRGPRGKDLYLRPDGSVTATGQFPFYTRPEDIHYIDRAELSCPAGTVAVITNGLGLLPPGSGLDSKPKPLWSARPFNENVAVAIGSNAVVVAGTNRRFERPDAEPQEKHGVTALSIKDGKPLWRQSLPAGPVSWGLAIDRHGRILVSLRDGRLICLGPRS